MISVGTTNADEVLREHRRKLLSITRFASNQILATAKIVPAVSWAEAQRKYPGQWKWGFPVKDLWEFFPYVDAYTVFPAAYKRFATFRGKPVELNKSEISALLGLIIEPKSFSPTADAKVVISQREVSELSPEVRRDIGRVVQLVIQRVQNSGEDVSRVFPIRSTSPDVDLAVFLTSLWRKQKGVCPLCFGRIEIEPDNKLLQMSVDRIVSENASYDESNIHITHLGCNLAKNKFSTEDFQEWLKTASARYLS